MPSALCLESLSCLKLPCVAFVLFLRSLFALFGACSMSQPGVLDKLMTLVHQMERVSGRSPRGQVAQHS